MNEREKLKNMRVLEAYDKDGNCIAWCGITTERIAEMLGEEVVKRLYMKQIPGAVSASIRN